MAKPVYVGGISGVGTSTGYTVSLSGTLTGGLASSPAAGDVVVVFSGFGNTASSAPAISGNTSGAYLAATAAQHINDTWDSEFRSFYQKMGATPDTTLTVTRTTNAAYGGGTTVQVWRGVDPTSPFIGAATPTSGGNGAALNPPAYDPAVTDSIIIAGGMGTMPSAGTAGYTSISGMSNAVVAYGNGSTADTSVIMASFEYAGASYDPATATGGTQNNTSSSWAGVTLALRPAPTPTVDLTAGNVNQANTSTSGAITQTHALTAGNVNQATTNTSAAISQTHLLSAGNVNQTNTSTSGAAVEVVTITLTAGNVAQANTSSSAAISQTHALSAGNAAQANTATTGAISQTHVLLAAAVAVDHIASASAIVQTHLLAGSSATTAHTSTSGAIAQAHALTSGNVTQANTSTTGAVDLTFTVHLSAGNVAQVNTATSAAITQTHELTGQGAVQGATSSTGAVAQTHALSAASVTQANTSTGGTISQTHLLSAGNVNQATSSTRARPLKPPPPS